jgi:hypothetical protein
VSARTPDLVGTLTRAARTDDARAFDDALDQLLERARDEADPEPIVQALVAERLREMPSVDTADGVGATRLGAAGGLGSASGVGATLARGGRVGRLAAATSRRLRHARGLGLLGAGIAVGFIWGRSPAWWPSQPVAPPDVTTMSAPIATGGGSALARDDAALARDAIASSLALAEGSPAPLGASQASGDPAGAMDPPEGTVDARKSAMNPPRRDASPVDTALPAPSRAKPRPTEADSLRSGPDSLRFALQQLRKAQIFLRASEPKRALDALDALDGRVAASILREEREVTRTLALCEAGDVARASALAQDFLERTPDSAYATSLRESCAGKAALLEQIQERASNRPR